MFIIPDWAPNLHPLVIHFPIVLLITAVACDLVDVVLHRPAWLGAAAASLYAAGAVAAVTAYLTGKNAAATVLIPGMAQPIVQEHQWWALVTASYFGLFAAVRLVALFRGFPRRRLYRVLFLVAGLIGVVLLQQTAERGARLVYQHGVGVVAAPWSR